MTFYCNCFISLRVTSKMWLSDKKECIELKSVAKWDGWSGKTIKLLYFSTFLIIFPPFDVGRPLKHLYKKRFSPILLFSFPQQFALSPSVFMILTWKVYVDAPWKWDFSVSKNFLFATFYFKVIEAPVVTFWLLA